MAKEKIKPRLLRVISIDGFRMAYVPIEMYQALLGSEGYANTKLVNYRGSYLIINRGKPMQIKVRINPDTTGWAEIKIPEEVYALAGGGDYALASLVKHRNSPALKIDAHADAAMKLWKEGKTS